MIKPIGPQYIAAKKSQRVGLTHVSSVIDRLMRIYGLEDELMEKRELEASEMQTAEMQTAEFEAEPTAMPALPVLAGTQNTFTWFE